MHEASIASALIGILNRQAALHGVLSMNRVTVRVGRLRAVEPRALAACFELMAENGPTEGAELVIESVPARGHCSSCGLDFEIERFRFRCAACRGTDIVLVSGEELYIESFETDDCGAAQAGLQEG